MEKYLFHNFLENNTVYQICQKYWITKMEYFFSRNHLQEYKPYLNTRFANGVDFANGNPIVNYYVATLNKAIRIIQEEPCDDDVLITAWIDKFEIQENTFIPELVVSLQLTPETEQILYDLISKWLVSNLPEQTMKRYIDVKLEISNIELQSA